MADAIATAAGIAEPSRTPCTPRTWPTPTTGRTDPVAARWERVAPRLGYGNDMSSEQAIDAARLRAAFVAADGLCDLVSSGP